MTLFLFTTAIFGTIQSTSSAKPPTTQKIEQFKPFTGKVVGNKVRIRVKPDVDSYVFGQAAKGELFLIVGEEGDFFAIQPPKETKAYLFRSYVLDDKVEASRVNVRLAPNTEAPVVCQLEAGEKVKGEVSKNHPKWLEIAIPSKAKLYLAKEYIESAGGPEYFASMQKKKQQLEENLNTAFALAEAECKKSYPEMNPQIASDKLQAILRSYSDFPEAVAQAKEALALLKETYLNKKIAFLEKNAELSTTAKEELISKHQAESVELFQDAPIIVDPSLWTKRNPKKESLTSWNAIEESLYLSWTSFHSAKKLEDFYAEQKANAIVLTGVLKSYDDPIKDRPGDYILMAQDTPLAYVYSTHVDLSSHVGEAVTLRASPRPNNHFAFPAYFILETITE